MSAFNDLTSIFTRTKKRAPMGEKLPDGRSVDEAVQGTPISDKMKKVSDDLLAARQAQPVESETPDLEAAPPTMRSMLPTVDAGGVQAFKTDAEATDPSTKHLRPEELPRNAGFSDKMAKLSDGLLQQRGQTNSGERTLVIPNKFSPNTIPTFQPWSKDDILPNETPEATIRRAHFKATWQPDDGPHREVGRWGRMSAEELESEPTGPKAQMPVSAVTKTALDNDGYGAGYTKSTLDPGYVPPAAQTVDGAQRETGADVSTIPPNERWQAMADAEREQTPSPQGNNITMDSPVDRVAGGRASAAAGAPTVQGSAQTPDAHLARINKLLDRLDQLEAAPAKDKNGRLKSAALTALHDALQGFAVGGLAGAAGGAIFGAAHGAIVPATDERLKQHIDLLKTRGELDHATKLEKARADIGKVLADTDKTRGEASNTPEKQRAALVKELKSRMALTGNKLNTRTDPRQADLAAQLGLSTSSGSGSFNPQRVRSVRVADGTDRLVYLDYQDGQIAPRYLDVEGDAKSATMSERDRKQVALQLERENLDRAKAGLPPIKFNEDDAVAPTGNAPTQAAPAVSTPTVNAPAPVGDVKPSPAQSAPAPRSSGMVPTGAPAEPVQHQRYGGGGFRRAGGGHYGGSSSGNDKSAQINNTVAIGLMRDIEEAKTRAAEAAKRGDVRGKQTYLQQANALVEAARHDPNLHGVVEVGSAPDEAGDAWPYIKMTAGNPPASSQPTAQTPQQQSGQYTGMKFKVSDAPKMAKEAGMTPVKLRRHIIAEGGQWIN